MCNWKNSHYPIQKKKKSMDLQFSYTSTGSLSLNFPLTAAVHLTLPCALVEHLNCHSLSSDTPSPRMTPSGCCWKELERVQLLPAQWPLHQHKVWCETYSRATVVPWRQQNILQPAELNTIHLLPLTSLGCLLQDTFPCISVLAKFSVTHVLPRYSRVVNSPQILQGSRVLMVSCFSSLSRVWQMEGLVWGGKQMFCFVFQQTMMLFLQNDLTRKQNPSKSQRSSSVWISL